MTRSFFCAALFNKIQNRKNCRSCLRKNAHTALTLQADSCHQNMTNTPRRGTCSEDHFYIRPKWLAFQGKTGEFPDTTLPSNSSTTSGLLSKNIAAPHPIVRMQSDDPFHDRQMCPTIVMKHSHCQQLPMTVPTPKKMWTIGLSKLHHHFQGFNWIVHTSL